MRNYCTIPVIEKAHIRIMKPFQEKRELNFLLMHGFMGIAKRKTEIQECFHH